MPRLFSSILERFSPRAEIDWDDLEETLIAGDLGVHLSLEIIESLRGQGRRITAGDVVETCRRRVLEILVPPALPLSALPDRPKVILVIGVNGVGKTTSIAKLAHHLKSRNKSVMLAAADTFRAAAIEQISVWADRLEVPVIKGPYQSDPSSVCFQAYEAAARDKADYLICDTAGRLHTRHNLMEELRKLRRTLAKKDEGSPHEILLVVDATTGSNALSQARQFNEILDLTGLIVTKLDGSGKGGVAVGIKKELGIPTRFIDTGEALEDLAAFDPVAFVEEIL
ncbi:MAG: signal recognition particle-docking protein FtsY [Verrucomicrobiales bacterium]